MPEVVIADTTQGAKAALDEIFNAFGGLRKLIPQEGGTVYIKPNGIHFTPHTHTDPNVLQAVLSLLRDYGYSRVAVMENCTAGNFTRLVFKITGYAGICRRYGAEPVYLDEGPTVRVELRDGTRVAVSKRLYTDIIQREGNFYLALPKLKTHSMSKVTLGVKGQQAFPVDGDRMHRHTHHTLHQRLAALFALTRPDFCIIEGVTATAHGHFPPTALLPECLVEKNIVIGGKDTLAVDVVGARILGYDVSEVEHLRLAAEWKLGEGYLENITVRGRSLDEFTDRLPYTLLKRFHPGVKWIVGRDKACIEGCRGNSECIQEMLYNDYHGRGDWTLICGSGFINDDWSDLPGDILIVGPCACREAAPFLERHYRDRKIYRVAEHNDLMTNTRYQARLMGVKPVRMVPGNPVGAAWTLLQAKWHGLTSRVPPLLG